MQKWEYLSIRAEWGGEDFSLRPFKQNGMEIANWQTGPTLFEYINNLGDDGWELISEYMDPNISATSWQYTWLWADKDWKQLKVGNKTYSGTDGYFDYIHQIGKAGWELVSTTPQSGSVTNPALAYIWFEDWLLVFKKPAEKSYVLLRVKRPKL